jgi:autotransporter-associated beta strand protein
VNIVKTGTGLWRLTGKNEYKGTTTVNGGTLIVNGQHTGTGLVTVAKGATLAGKGTLAGAVTVNGTLLVGDEGATDKGLTIKGKLTLGSGAILELNEAMQAKTYTNGQTIQAFTGTATGTFAEIIPATPGEGQSWDTTELYTSGVLKVVGEGTTEDPTPEDPTPDDPGEAGPTVRATLAWGNCSREPSDAACTTLVGREESPSNNVGLSMVYTTATDKTYSSSGTPKFNYEFDDVSAVGGRTGIVVSNGAQNSIILPENGRATKLILYSVTNNNASSRTTYWKEVAGVEYTESTTTVLDLNATRDNPNAVEFTLNNVPDKFTFTNTGEQQCVIVYIEYHFGGATGIQAVSANGTPLRIEYYTLSGERIATPGKGIYVMRTILEDGKAISRKVIF